MMTIDLHTHGISGLDTRTTDEAVILEFASVQSSKGVDAFLPTIYPGPLNIMRSQIEAVKRAMLAQAHRADLAASTRAVGQARILGVHVEGPFLNPKYAGALDPSCLLRPDEREMEALMEGFEDVIKIVTLAPELPGALRLIERLSSKGIVVSMGHSDATFAQAEEGCRAGARGITHLFNAMRVLHQREPGIAGFGLIHDNVYVEIIADPHHLHRSIIDLIFRTKNPRRVLIVSDSVRGTQLSPGDGAVRDQMGVLQGGGLAVTESARMLMQRGLDRSVVHNCITVNPAAYLNLASRDLQSV